MSKGDRKKKQQRMRKAKRGGEKFKPTKGAFGNGSKFNKRPKEKKEEEV